MLDSMPFVGVAGNANATPVRPVEGTLSPTAEGADSLTSEEEVDGVEACCPTCAVGADSLGTASTEGTGGLGSGWKSGALPGTARCGSAGTDAT